MEPPPNRAVMTAETEAVTAVVSIRNSAAVAPAATFTEAGRERARYTPSPGIRNKAVSGKPRGRFGC